MTRLVCGEANTKGPEGLGQGRNIEECLKCNIKGKEYKDLGSSSVEAMLPGNWGTI